MEKALQVLYEDNHLLAVFKPTGLLVQGDKSDQITLFEIAKKYLKDKYKKPGNVYLGLVHRLDKVTAGVVVFAKTSKSASRLSCEFRERRVRKLYLAIVEGEIPEQGILKHILLRDKQKGTSRIIKKIVPGAQKVELSFRVIKRTSAGALLEVIPETGRHHQIRAQLSAFGYPVQGDTRYGAKKRLPDGMISLFACQISFCHPVKKEKITIPAPVPPDFQNI